MWWSGERIRWSCNTAAILGCSPAEAAIDMAVWQWAASFKGQTLESLIGIESNQVPHTFTLGISGLEEMREKYAFAIEQDFRFFKLKMDGIHDQAMLEQFRSLTDAPFAIDANQGWQPGKASDQWAKSLQSSGCVLIEQPFQKDQHEAHFQLKNQLSIPVIADEGIQNVTDWIQFGHCYSGTNIKLQKCGGLSNGIALLEKCQAAQQFVLVGCMSESSIGCSAGEALVGGAQMADLDGPWLISNDQEIMALANAM
jgi:L-alanine-DL-glutamate epimerase-like enolase superfamily enzyme